MYWMRHPCPFDMRNVSGESTAGLAAHQPVVDAVDDLRRRERRGAVQRADLLGDIEDAPPVRQTTSACGGDVESGGGDVWSHAPRDRERPRASGVYSNPGNAA